MKNEKIALAILTGTVLASPAINANPSLKTQALSNPALTFTREQLVDLGFDTNSFTNRFGEKRSLTPYELVKVEIHEEDNVISFSSFDDYALTVNAAAEASNPRNIGGADFER